MTTNFSFQEEQFNRLFPFYILIGEDLHIASVGKTLDKLFPGTSGNHFFDNYLVKRPELKETSFDDLKAMWLQLLVLECRNPQKTPLRGQMEYLPETNQLLFLGSPWFGSIEQVIKSNLTLHDFAYHDPMIDLLHVLKTSEITTEDLKQLLNTINQQKNELKKANKEIHEVALFPTQNPDPLIRINLAGELLRRNPAAEELNSFEYEGRTLTSENLFRHIAPLIDKTSERWIFEASSRGKAFSFVCITIKDAGYINIYGRDITQLKRDQKELERLSLIVQETINAVIVTDAAGKVEWTNKAFEKVTGYSMEEVLGKTPGSLLQGKETDRETVQFMNTQIRQGLPFTSEIYNYKKTGEGYWLRINAQPIFDAGGNISQFFAIEEDITFEKEAQEKLEAAASRMSSLITNLHAGVLLENDDRTIALVNQEFCQLFDIPADPSQMIGADCSQASQQSKHLFKDPEAFVHRIDDILRQRELVVGDEMELKDGRFYERDFVPIWNDQRYDGHLWVYTDVTEKINSDKKLEEQRIFYEEILDQIPADIAVFDTNHRYLYINPKGIQDTELRKWMIGKKDEDYARYRNKPESLVTRRRILFNAVMSSRQLKSWEEEFVLPDGTNKNILRYLYPVLDGQGAVKLLIGYGVDITDRVKAEKELKIAKQITEELAQTKQNFLANMSHEIRTPMNAIMGMANQLAKTTLTQDQYKYLSTIRSASENLLVIINDILDLSKIEAGKLTLEQMGFEPTLVVGRVMQVMMHKAEEKGILLTNSICDSRLSPVLLGDPYRLNQILLNLLSNAIKFTEHGGVDISCHVLRETSGEQTVKVVVMDTGIGMEESFVKNLFNKFTQEDGSVTRKFGGTGLGMSICKELAELMGGEIEVESLKGKGTTVSFIVTFKKGTVDQLPVKNIENIQTDILRGKKILVTDDNEMNRLVAATILKNYGVVVEEAQNGLEALERLKSELFDVVLMDIQMPEMDGIEATRCIREQVSKSLPVIALTAYALKGDDAKLLDAGMNDYLSKPFEENQLLQVLTRWLKKTDLAAPQADPSFEKPGSATSLYNLKSLQEIAKGNSAFVDKMVRLFMDLAPSTMNEMKEAYAVQQFEKIKKTAHRLKPSLDNMGIESVRQDIREIEELALSPIGSSRLQELISNLDNVIAAVVADLKEKEGSKVEW